MFVHVIVSSFDMFMARSESTECGLVLLLTKVLPPEEDFGICLYF